MKKSKKIPFFISYDNRKVMENDNSGHKQAVCFFYQKNGEIFEMGWRGKLLLQQREEGGGGAREPLYNENTKYVLFISTLKKKRGFSPPYSVASCCDFSERRGNTRRIEIRKKNILFNWGKGKAKGLSALFHQFYIYFSFSGVSVIFLPPSLIENPPMEVFFYFKKGVPYGSIVSFSVRHPVFRHFVKKFPTFF